MSTDCDHLVWFKEVDDYETGRRHYPLTVSDLTEGIWSVFDAEETSRLEPDANEHIFTFCPDCGSRIDWEAIRAWAKAYIDKAEQERKAKMQEKEDRHMAEVRNIRAASFGDVLPP